MRSANAAVTTLLDSREPFVYADCYTFTLRDGTKLRYTNAQYAIDFIPYGEVNPARFEAKKVLIDGMKFKSSIGIDVDEQDCKMYVAPGQTINGVDFLTAVRRGVLDKAILYRERLYMSDWGQPVKGGVVMFIGRVSTLDPAGDTTVMMKVKSETVTLDENMPRNYFQMECKHTLFDGGCTLNKAAFAVAGLAGAGSTSIQINWASATADTYDLGTVTMESGANVGQKRTIRRSDGSSLLLVTPFEYPVAENDAFKAYPGCDLQYDTCLNKFSNQDNFRGFPYVPTPERAY